MLSEADILEAIRTGRATLPPLTVRLVGREPGSRVDRGPFRPDAYVDIESGSQTYRFVAKVKAQATPKAFQEAIEQIRAYAVASEMRPLVVTAYLPPERLEELEAKGVSGIDLCGNGIVVVPGEVLVVRTGHRNQYPAARRIRNVYQGASSLVARVFLARPRYDSVQEVMDEVVRRGGRVSLSTVSKVLKVLDEDLVIRREGRASKLLQPDELLARLASAYRPPRISIRRKYRWTSGSAEAEAASSLRGWSQPLVQTGASSVDVYGVMPRERSAEWYCDAMAPIEERLRGQLDEAPRFPDLELIQTGDPTVYFDRRVGATIPVASPVQCWLELQAGDKRQKDASRTVKTRILKELHNTGWSAP